MFTTNNQKLIGSSFEVAPKSAKLQNDQDKNTETQNFTVVDSSEKDLVLNDSEMTPVRSSTTSSWELSKRNACATSTFEMTPNLQDTPILNFKREMLETPAGIHKMFTRVDTPVLKRTPVNQVRKTDFSLLTFNHSI